MPNTGALIRRRRQLLGMTQKQVADALGVAESSVANWEHGRHFPNRHQARVEELLGISLDEEPQLPRLVEQNLHVHGVKEIWELRALPEDTRLGLIRKLLADQAQSVTG